jgi:hypothetical protein
MIVTPCAFVLNMPMLPLGFLPTPGTVLAGLGSKQAQANLGNEISFPMLTGM